MKDSNPLPPSPDELAPGTRFGHYEIVRLLGRGGMGEVYEARHTTLHRSYALKLIHPAILAQPGALARFQEEARRSAELEHPKIVRVDEFNDVGGRHYLRMELMEGVDAGSGEPVASLEDYLQARGGRLDVAEVARLARDVLAGLAHAHRSGVIHRDLKPANVLLSPAGAKLADFGLVKAMTPQELEARIRLSVSKSRIVVRQSGGSGGGGAGRGATPGTLDSAERAYVGTYDYMAPEQREGAEATVRSDLYAVGLMMYRLLTGSKVPGLRPISQTVKGLSPVWDEWMMRALDPEAAGRFASAEEMLAALPAAGGDQRGTTKDTKDTKSDDSAVGGGEGKNRRRRERETGRSGVTGESAIGHRKSKAPLMGAAVAVLVVLAGAGYYFGVHAPEQARRAEVARVEAAARAAADAKERVRLEAEAVRLRAEQERAAAEAARREAARGGLIVNTTPEGAEVRVGAIAREKSPLGLKDQKLGKYPVRIRLEGYEDWEGEAEIKENEFTELNVTLVKLVGTLQVSSSPAGAAVAIDGRAAGRTPVTVGDVPPGQYELELILPGYQPARRSVTVAARRTTRESVALEKQPYPRAGQAWENTLGMKFAPVPGVGVLFGVWEVRVRDYEAFASATGRSWSKPNFTQGPDHPAVNVSWEDAQAFCEWLTEKERKEGKIGLAQRYRLPQDWEWSVAVGLNESREGTPHSKNMKVKGEYPWGTQWPPPRGAGNYSGSLNVDNHETTAPVGSFSANRFGLHDLGGNVWEWCEDFYDGNSGGRVQRGDSFGNPNPDFLLSSCRVSGTARDAFDRLGFRCGLEVGSAR